MTRADPPAQSGAARQAGQDDPSAGTLDLRSPTLGVWTRVRPPDAGTPFWRDEGGRRHSYGALRCGLDRPTVSALRRAHLEAIGRLAAAALDASERGDRRETARLACAAARLCGEIRGLWPPSAVKTPKR